MTRQTYTSPDGQLRFTVVSDGDDMILGFEGYPWHTHADLLAAHYALSNDAAVDRFVSELLSGKAVIAISRNRGSTSDISVTHAPESDLKYVLPEETVELRYWDGTLWQPETRSS